MTARNAWNGAKKLGAANATYPPANVTRPASINTVAWRRSRTPIVSNASPEEYKFMIDADTNASTAKLTYGTRNHVGRCAASAPTGSATAASATVESPAARRIPNISKITGAALAPSVVQPTTACRLAARG